MTTVKLIRVAEPVEAWQYDGSVMSSFWSMPHWAFRVTEATADELFLVRRSGKQLINPGDWLIRNLDAEPEWMTNEERERLYRVVT